jgi:hypothetical protein
MIRPRWRFEARTRWYHPGHWSYTMRRHHYASLILISALLDFLWLYAVWLNWRS